MGFVDRVQGNNARKTAQLSSTAPFPGEKTEDRGKLMERAKQAENRRQGLAKELVSLWADHSFRGVAKGTLE